MDIFSTNFLITSPSIPTIRMPLVSANLLSDGVGTPAITNAASIEPSTKEFGISENPKAPFYLSLWA